MEIVWPWQNVVHLHVPQYRSHPALVNLHCPPHSRLLLVRPGSRVVWDILPSAHHSRPPEIWPWPVAILVIRGLRHEPKVLLGVSHENGRRKGVSRVPDTLAVGERRQRIGGRDVMNP